MVDVADNCPSIPNGPHQDNNQLDSDGDGVGDLCDPNPTVEGDVMVAFETFENANDDELNDPLRWRSLGGQWRLVDDALVQQLSLEIATLVFDPENNYQLPLVVVTLGTPSGSMAEAVTGTYLILADASLTDTPPAGLGCALRYRGPSQPPVIEGVDNRSGNGDLVTQTLNNDGGDSFAPWIDTVDDTFNRPVCYGQQLDASTASAQAFGSDFLRNPVKIALITSFASVEFRSLTVYGQR